MRFNVRLAVFAGGVLLAANPAYAEYVVQPIDAPGDFTPVTITDDDVVVGTLVTARGSLAFLTNKTSSIAYDFCGTHGAADHTIITATPPYSVSRYIAGACGYSSSFLYDVVRRAVIPIATASTSGTTISAVGPNGMVAGIIDTHSGGNVAYFERKGVYTTFYPGEFTVISQITLSGLIVGYWTDLGGAGSGFTMWPGYAPRIVQPPVPAVGNFVSFFGGNRRGQLAAAVVDPQKSRAAVWQSGHFTYLQLSPGAVNSASRAINEAGDVAGTFQDKAGNTHVFVWHISSNLVDDLPAPAGAAGFSVTAINNSGDIVGVYTLENRITAYTAVDKAGVPLLRNSRK